MLFQKNKKYIGNWGEVLVVKRLKHYGFNILYHPFKSKYGEIDIIAEYQDNLYFIEVKTRQSNIFPNLTQKQKNNIIHLSQTFLTTYKKIYNNIFISVAIVRKEKDKTTIQWIKTAFEIS